MKKSQITLSDTQLSIMRVLWAHGEADTQTVCDALASRTHKPAYTTVATLLKRLEKRGLVAHTAQDRKLIYSPLVSEQEVRTSMVAQMVGSLFKGDSAALLSHLIREREIGANDLETLMQMIDKEAKP